MNGSSSAAAAPGALTDQKRSEALGHLQQLNNGASVDARLAGLRGLSATLSAPAVTALHGVFLPALLEFIRDPNPPIRAGVACALATLPMQLVLSHEVTETLFVLLGDEHPTVLRETVRTVSRVFYSVVRGATGVEEGVSCTRELWGKWEQVIGLVCDTAVAGTASIGLQCLAIRFLQSVIIAFTKPEQGISVRTELFQLKMVVGAGSAVSASSLASIGSRALDTLLATITSSADEGATRILNASLLALHSIFRRRPRSSAQRVLSAVNSLARTALPRRTAEAAVRVGTGAKASAASLAAHLRWSVLMMLKSPFSRSDQVRVILFPVAEILGVGGVATALMNGIDRHCRNSPVVQLWEVATQSDIAGQIDTAGTRSTQTKHVEVVRMSMAEAQSAVIALATTRSPYALVQMAMKGLGELPQRWSTLEADFKAKAEGLSGPASGSAAVKKRTKLKDDGEEERDPRVEVRAARNEKIKAIELEEDEEEPEELAGRSSTEPTSGWIDAGPSVRLGSSMRSRHARRLATVKTVAPKVVVPKLSPQAVVKVTSLIVQKILKLSPATTGTGASELRLCLLAILLTRSGDETLIANVVVAICKDFDQQRELAITWLNRELAVVIQAGLGFQQIAFAPKSKDDDMKDDDGHAKDTNMKDEDTDLKDDPESPELMETKPNEIVRYQKLLDQFADRLLSIPNSDTAERHVSFLLGTAPLVTDSVFSMMEERCQDSGTVVSSLSILKSVILERGGKDREKALGIILGLSIGQNSLLRGPAIRLLAGELYRKKFLEPSIQNFAVNGLEGSLEPLDFMSKAHVFMALCQKNNDLLLDMAEIFVKAIPENRGTILSHVQEFGKAMGRESSALLALVRGEVEAATGADDLVLALLNAVPPEMIPQEANAPLISAARDRYHGHQDARFMVPVISALEREELVTLLPKLMSLPKESGLLKVVVLKLVGAPTHVLPPSDIVVELNLAFNRGDASRIDLVQALRVCLDLRAVFTQDVLTTAIRRLADTEPIPQPVMLTVILALQAHSTLENFVLEVLRELVEKEIWDISETIWEGLIKCCELTPQRSLPIILSLPTSQLSVVLRKSERVKRLLKRAVANPNNSIPGFQSAIIDAA